MFWFSTTRAPTTSIIVGLLVCFWLLIFCFAVMFTKMECSCVTCVCVCMCACVHTCVCACVCVWIGPRLSLLSLATWLVLMITDNPSTQLSMSI